MCSVPCVVFVVVLSVCETWQKRVAAATVCAWSKCVRRRRTDAASCMAKIIKHERISGRACPRGSRRADIYYLPVSSFAARTNANTCIANVPLCTITISQLFFSFMRRLDIAPRGT